MGERRDVVHRRDVRRSRCRGYRLPTAAEWEYAYQPAQTALYNGPLSRLDCVPDANLDAIAWYCDNASVSYSGCVDRTERGGSRCAGTYPVGGKAPNAWGLYDMAGNVWRTSGTGTAQPSGGVDPIGADRGTHRVIRGGSWHNPPGDFAQRGTTTPTTGLASATTPRGFRLVRTDIR